MDHSKIDIDLTPLKNASDPKLRADVAQWEGQAAERRKREERRKRYVSAPGAIPNLDPKVDAKRIEHTIPDICLTYSQPLFDWCFLYQIDRVKDDKYEGGLIVMTDEARDAEKYMMPRAILLAAGARAMDYLWSHGIELGDEVTFLKFQQWRLPVGLIEGKTEYVLPMHASRIVGGQDLRARILGGEMWIERQKDGQHMICDAAGPRASVQTYTENDE